MIWEELNENLVFESLDAKSTDAIFEQMGRKMIDGGFAKESYIEGLKKREAEFPTGLDLGEIGVAIPHTEVEFALQEAFAIARLKEPVSFIQMGSDDEPVQVHLVIMMCVKHPHEHLEHLTRILKIIQDTNTLKRILKAKGRSEMIHALKDKEMELEIEAIRCQDTPTIRA